MNKTFKFIKKNPIVTAILTCVSVLIVMQIIPIIIIFFIVALFMMLARKALWGSQN